MGRSINQIDKIITSKKNIITNLSIIKNDTIEAEGGCGVIGVASTIPIKGKYLFQSLIQMHNRGNGKGGGIAAVGLSHKQLGVTPKILENSYLLLIAYLDSISREQVEKECIYPYFDIKSVKKIDTINDYKVIGLEVKPPDVWSYFVNVKEDAINNFKIINGLENLSREQLEDEFIYRNSYMLNTRFYASLGDKKAFVLSHGKNMMVLKIVGYAEQVIQYYKLEDFEAQIWIGHQRYPTKGKIWHPGGSHPFIGLNDILIHNGDFANYHSIAEYLKQRNIYPLFLTDTEVAALYWDLLTRTYQYPLEYAIEAIAPTTEKDFTMLPKAKKKIYKAIQTTHIHGSPDGPWFFIVARNNLSEKQLQLIGITDTSMLRPQVFALQERDIKIGLIASEKQAIDTILSCLSKDDKRYSPIADRYWYARGGSYTDGGAFIFTINKSKNLNCTDKFGKKVKILDNNKHYFKRETCNSQNFLSINKKIFRNLEPKVLFEYLSNNIRNWDIDRTVLFLENLRKYASKGHIEKTFAIEILTLLIDRRYDFGRKFRSDLITLYEEKLYEIFNSLPQVVANSVNKYFRIDYNQRDKLFKPLTSDQILVVDVYDFKAEGNNGTCQFLQRAYDLGWRNFIAYNFRGQRNFGAGLITSEKVKIDIYGRVGDCLAAFADGPEFHVHESVQDSVAYCFRSGKIVIYGDVGKTFEYGAKGGVAFVLGDLVDRPLINSVGSATAIINGSCKDYLGESCMSASGFTVINGIKFSENGKILSQETPYHGGNLFPLAAAGTVYLRDPFKTVGEDQLNGSKISSISNNDWKIILPLLKENERLFDIKIKYLLTVNGRVRKPEHVYRKVIPLKVVALTKYDRGM